MVMTAISRTGTEREKWTHSRRRGGFQSYAGEVLFLSFLFVTEVPDDSLE